MANLTPEARAARNAYMREYRRKNPDKVRQYEINRWERRAEKIRAERQSRQAEETA